MIIETFGPPGAGKTTFTESLAHRLRERGYVVDLMLTLPRIENRFLTVGGFIPAIARVSRAIGITIVILCRPFQNAKGLRLARNLLRLMPPKRTIWRIRLTQYVMRFCCVWTETLQQKPSHIVIFDQGFVQVALTLALFSESDAMTVARAMEMRAKVDLLIHLDAPHGLLEQRLHQRIERKPGMEKWFEADTPTFLKAGPIVDHLASIIASNGDPILHINSLDEPSLNEAVELVEREIAKRDASAQPPPTPLRYREHRPRADTSTRAPAREKRLFLRMNDERTVGWSDNSFHQ